jgi:hypothetical protein
VVHLTDAFTGHEESLPPISLASMETNPTGLQLSDGAFAFTDGVALVLLTNPA